MPYNRNEQASLLNLLSALQAGMSGAQGLQIYNYLVGQNAARIAERQAQTQGLIDLLAGQAQSGQEFEGARALARAYQGGPLSPRIRQAMRALYPRGVGEDPQAAALVEKTRNYQSPGLRGVAAQIGQNIQDFLPAFLRGAPIEGRPTKPEPLTFRDWALSGFSGEAREASDQAQREYQRHLDLAEERRDWTPSQEPWTAEDVMSKYQPDRSLLDELESAVASQRISPAASGPSIEQQRLSQELAQDAAETQMSESYATIIAQLGLGEIQTKMTEETAQGNEVDPMTMLAKWMSSPVFKELDDDTKQKVIPILFQMLLQLQTEARATEAEEEGGPLAYGAGGGTVNPASPWGP